jgi:hypothetical protein
VNIASVRQALADAADTIAGLNCYAYTPNAVAEPAFVVGEVSIDFDEAFGRGMDRLTVACRVLVSAADDKSGQGNLDAYLAGSGSSSVKAALEAARGAPGSLALSGAADDLRVMRMSGYRMYQVGDDHYYGAEFTVLVIGSGA